MFVLAERKIKRGKNDEIKDTDELHAIAWNEVAEVPMDAGPEDKFPWQCLSLYYIPPWRRRPATKRVTGIKRIVRRVFTRSFDNSRQYKTPCAAALPLPLLAFLAPKKICRGSVDFPRGAVRLKSSVTAGESESESFKLSASLHGRWLKYTRDIWIRTTSLRARFFSLSFFFFFFCW